MMGQAGEDQGGADEPEGGSAVIPPVPVLVPVLSAVVEVPPRVCPARESTISISFCSPAVNDPHGASTTGNGAWVGAMTTPPFEPTTIAPCGMNCGICRAYLRQKNPCRGCAAPGIVRFKSCENCRMRRCERRTGPFCFDCTEFPCERLRHLDRRYRTKYGMSEIENLEFIRDHGIEAFLEMERERWVSDRGILCVHDRKYYPVKRE